MPNSVLYQYYTAPQAIHRKKWYRKSSHRLRQEEAEQTAARFSEQSQSCTAEGESGEENRPDEAGGDSPAGGHHG